MRWTVLIRMQVEWRSVTKLEMTTSDYFFPFSLRLTKRKGILTSSDIRTETSSCFQNG